MLSNDIQFVPQFLTIEQADRLLEMLKEMPGWQQDNIQIYGRSIPLPRLHRWFAEFNETYHWSGLEMRPEPFPEALRGLLQRLEAENGTKFNTSLGNLYRGGKDSVSWHSDDEPELGVNPVIASLSLGATRRFLMRRKDRSETMTFDLTHGSLLWMAGSTQTHWEHSLPKTTKDVDPRINLTFRVIHRQAKST